MEVNVAVVTLRQRHKQSPIERIVLDIVAMATDHPDHEQVVRRTVFRRLGVTNRSEEHTSELQSQSNLVCRLLLEKKKNKNKFSYMRTFIIIHIDYYLDNDFNQSSSSLTHHMHELHRINILQQNTISDNYDRSYSH